MLIGFGDLALKRLYETGVDDALPTEVIRGFFSVLETVTASRDLDDLRALASLDVRESGGSTITMQVTGSHRVSATMEEGDSGSILRVDTMTHGGGPDGG